MSKVRVREYEVTVARRGWEEFSSLQNTTSRGKAKAAVLLDLSDLYDALKYTDLRCRVVGPPSDSDMFRHVCEIRGMPPGFHCGSRVAVRGRNEKHGEGIVTGTAGGANFAVLMVTGKWAGDGLCVHPSEIEILPREASA